MTRRVAAPAEGALVVVCGIDGAGKTTLMHGLADALGRLPRPRRTLVTKLITAEGDFFAHLVQLMEAEPDLDPEVQNWLFAFERFRRANTVLPGLLAAHDVVVVDRYLYCDLAYATGRGLRTSMLRRIIERSPRPDAGFVVDVPVELAMERILARAKPPWAFQENEPLLRSTREVFLALAEEYGLSVIDGGGEPRVAVARMLGVLERRGVLAERRAVGGAR